jgi:hypothetical protein
MQGAAVMTRVRGTSKAAVVPERGAAAARVPSALKASMRPEELTSPRMQSYGERSQGEW